MKIINTFLLTTLFWAAVAAIMSGAFVAGAYQAGNVINVVTVPREMDVYAATKEDMRAIEASANSFPFGKGR